MATYWKPRSNVILIPLIDIFVTLIFFYAIFSSINGGNAAVPVRVPNSKTAPAVKTGRLVVALDKDGRYLINGKPATSAEVTGYVSLALSQNPGLQVVLFPDQAVSYQTLVTALDLVREGGADRPALGVNRQAFSPGEIEVR